jgi:hypothetical protein
LIRRGWGWSLLSFISQIHNRHHWKVTVVMTEMPEIVEPLVSSIIGAETPVTPVAAEAIAKSPVTGSVPVVGIVKVIVANAPVVIPVVVAKSKITSPGLFELAEKNWPLPTPDATGGLVVLTLSPLVVGYVRVA